MRLLATAVVVGHNDARRGGSGSEFDQDLDQDKDQNLDQDEDQDKDQDLDQDKGLDQDKDQHLDLDQDLETYVNNLMWSTCVLNHM